MKKGSLISKQQKPILSSNECAEHNSYVYSIEKAQKTDNLRFYLCWLDPGEAFSSIPHVLIWKTLDSIDFINLFKELYKNVFMTNMGKVTGKVKLFKDVKQARSDPLILSDTRFSILEYADNYCIDRENNNWKDRSSRYQSNFTWSLNHLNDDTSTVLIRMKSSLRYVDRH